MKINELEYELETRCRRKIDGHFLKTRHKVHVMKIPWTSMYNKVKKNVELWGGEIFIASITSVCHREAVYLGATPEKSYRDSIHGRNHGKVAEWSQVHCIEGTGLSQVSQPWLSRAHCHCWKWQVITCTHVRMRVWKQ